MDPALLPGLRSAADSRGEYTRQYVRLNIRRIERLSAMPGARITPSGFAPAPPSK
jgi:hypothetical protein